MNKRLSLQIKSGNTCFAAEPYETIAFKVPSREVDKEGKKFWTHWNKETKQFFLQFAFKIDLSRISMILPPPPSSAPVMPSSAPRPPPPVVPSIKATPTAVPQALPPMKPPLVNQLRPPGIVPLPPPGSRPPVIPPPPNNL